ncbi:MAG TPA: SIS domain-containing protein [Mycobacteriales bacterium]|nr:SIS domain-containing protein [Mycobacteriales bacterium]
MTDLPTVEDLLDDPAAVAAGDPGEMLHAVATSGAQVRAAVATARDVDWSELTAGGRPRAVVVAGMGGSGIAGDVLAALVAPSAPAVVVPHKGYGLPAWVGATDLVVGVSCSGSTEETLSAVDEARRRGAFIVGVGGPGSPLEDRCGPCFVAVRDGGRPPRANLWALSVPLLVIADALGLARLPDADLEAAASLLDEVALRCRAQSEGFVNPAKLLALALSGQLPLVWGAGPLAAVAAVRFAAQLAENAKWLAVAGALPEAQHNQVVALDGGGRAGPGVGSPFGEYRTSPPQAVHLVLLRDVDEHPQVARRADASHDIAQQRGVPVSELRSDGRSPAERLASLVGLLDFTSVYCAVLAGIDPTPIAAIEELKRRISE